MNQPAYAGIAGLSVRALKPTGLQAGGCLVITTSDFIGYAICLKKNESPDCCYPYK